ncbi:MAG: hypothetical protein FJW30_28290 [Acidobacteria bacterium]|nr:hypothetical protein [Acidobacteriota bacterium]
MTRVFTENLGPKAMSLVIATLLWLAVVGERELSTAIDVPVEFRNFPKNLEVSNDAVNRVNLMISGPAGKMTDAILKEATVVVDLEEVNRPGERTFNLDGRTIRLPAGLQLERAVPTQIRMRFEERFARDVPVRIRYEGNPMPGFRIARQEVQPETLRIVGPRSRVERVNAVETDPVEMNGVIGELESKTSTFVDDPQVRIDGNSTVRIRLVLERIGMEQ